VAYLIYLAVRQWRSTAVDLTEQMGEPAGGRGPAMLVRGSLVNITNPKGLVFLLAVVPQFVVPTAPLLPQYLAIGATMTAVDLVVMGGYAALAARLLRWPHTRRRQTVVNRMLSGLFATAAVGLSLMRRAAA
jgi:homoserine/homoserine lactone efflux protein